MATDEPAQHASQDFTEEGAIEVAWGQVDQYEIVRKLGRGRSSEVFEGIRLVDYQRCAIKSLKPAEKTKVVNEIKMLQTLRGGPNIIQLWDVVVDPRSNTTSLIFELVDNVDFRSLYPLLDDNEIRYYLRELLRALEFCHSKGVMHRGVTPHNVVIDHSKRKLRLIDFGSSSTCMPGTTYDVRLGRVFGAPELLLDFEEYDYSLDMWCLGEMLASMIFRIQPFFHGFSRLNCLEQIATTLGTKGLLNYIERYDMDAPDVDDIPVHEGRSWTSYVTHENGGLANDVAIDLVDRLLRWDHQDRLTATKALEHPYFASLEEGTRL
ncbi:kinase-like protein [Sodiomyces alkalinus F11]|uniref:non-specific serine/threonine protein kinase n=1 Tax=Sodiomyces alkalinus (strain CBS 110278 / VKM F-3762 / F11) TaxID=1314773 RepID=A0A3N2Q611_SODAK|nr:kinase-like protein [Sodiomyces alkalinus F11]ROT42211.1 kinase-like protein [Sodiomyces alkalinus F11]